MSWARFSAHSHEPVIAGPHAARVKHRLRRHSAVAAVAVLLAACGTSPSASGTAAGSPLPSIAPDAPSVQETPAASSAEPAAVGWRRVSSSGPEPRAREDHTWTLTPDGATAYLFGGRTASGAALDDLWAYDLAGAEWERIGAVGPPARFGHNAAWVEGVGLVIFAGQSDAAFYNDLWAFDPADGRWTRLPAGGDRPVARYGSCAAIGPDGRLWISHGFTSEGTRFADTRAYDFSTASWTDETPVGERPRERCLHGCWWTGDGRLALYAGQTTGVPALGDLWLMTQGPRPGTNGWSMVEEGQPWPLARQLYSSARWEDATIIFGGRALDSEYLADVWLIDDHGAATRVRLQGDRPAARSGAELITDPTDARLLLFGGRDADDAMNDVWELRLPAP
jgi:hypothetical protein